ncbi:MAG: hypothetical protein BWY25_02730 [Chloroflexi bacterium ADurb.Bin222]|nr:MAG: hypothetical protein BWY25_02730 [Chloroflexi bacterium ADurb.Bin222]
MMAFEQSRTQVVGACLTLDQRRAVEAIAAECGVSVSAVMRAALSRLLELRPEAVGRCVAGEGQAYAGTG